MSHYPGAIFKPVAYRGLSRRLAYRAGIIHTNGSKGRDLKGWWDSCASGGQGQAKVHVGAHYQTLVDGTVFCYVDCDWVVYHAYDASTWALAIENQDSGDPANPLTDAQIVSCAAILTFHGVPARELTGPNPDHGVGWHQKEAAWNKSGHGCPGAVRVAQIPAILAAMNPVQEDDMTPAQEAKLDQVIAALPDIAKAREFAIYAASQTTPDAIHARVAEVLRSEGVSGAGDPARLSAAIANAMKAKT